MDNNLINLMAAAEYHDKLQEANKMVAMQMNKRLDAMLEMKILQENMGSESQSLKSIAKILNKPFAVVWIQYKMKKLKYKLA
jgi:hypothetical protein